MSGLARAAAAARRGVVRLLPPGRREWTEALWAEAHQVPPGWARLAWRAGGLQVIAHGVLARHRAGRVLLFAAAAAVMTWATWPGGADSLVTAVARADVITTIVLLTALPLLSRRLFGPVQPSRIARVLRVSAYAAILTLIPAKAVVERFAYAVPRNIHDRRLFLAIYGQLGPRSKFGPGEVVFLVVVVAYVTAIFWITSRRSSVAPATMAIGAGGGVLFGTVMYSVAPLGLNKYATNPWLPGSAVDPLVVLAWVLLFGVPLAAAVLAGRCYPGPLDSCPGFPGPADSCPRYPGPADPRSPMQTKMGQGFVAGVLASMSGALIVTVVGTGTIALMLHAAWLRSLIDHGHHLNAVVLYSHEIDASANAPAYLLMCVAFPVIGLFMSAWMNVLFLGDPAGGPGGPPRGGGPDGPGPAPDGPTGGRRVEAGSAGQRPTADPFPDPGTDGEDAAELVGAAAGGAMT